jgi:IS605 OrfB family transposase
LRTFCTVIRDARAEETLAPWGELNGRLLPWAFREIHVRGRRVGEVKKQAQAEFGVTARQFNGIRYDLDQQVAAWKGTLRHRESTLADRVERMEGLVAAWDRRLADPNPRRPMSNRRREDILFRRHGKQRHIATCKAELAAVRADMARDVPRVCFGGRELLKQGDVDAWRARRGGRINLVGASCETAGNQTAQWSPDGTLRLRLPDALFPAGTKDRDKVVVLEGVTFRYGQAELEAALARGVALTWLLFRRDDGLWVAHVSFEEVPAELATDVRCGVVAFDTNADHLAVQMVDRMGNPVGDRLRLPFPVAGTDSDKATAMVGGAVAFLCRLATVRGYGIACELLDFSKKKAALKVYGKRHARRLSGFAYAKLAEFLVARCARDGVDLHQVNPAFTSVIGRTKYARCRAMSAHEAAALVIGRRALGFGERLVDMHGVTLDSPGRMSPRHVPGRWRGVGRRRAREDSRESVRTARSETGTRRTGAAAGIMPEPPGRACGTTAACPRGPRSARRQPGPPLARRPESALQHA